MHGTLTQGERLGILAGKIKREHAATERAAARARETAREALDHAIAAGELLLEAKDLLKKQQGSSHGHWLPWLDQHVGIPPRTAQHYMRLARHAGQIRNVAHLKVREALKLIAADDTDAPDILQSSAEEDAELPPDIVALLNAMRRRVEFERLRGWFDNPQADAGPYTAELLDEAANWIRAEAERVRQGLS
jgi:hypothetical protein